MAAPIDITGARFGALVALKRTPRPDRAGSWWALHCDCGRDTVAPLNRLRVPDTDQRAIRACERCRSRRCSVCGEPYLTAGSTATCGDAQCRLLNRRAVNAAAAAAAAARDPQYYSRLNRAFRAILVAAPERLEAARARGAESARRRRRAIAADPQAMETRRAQQRAYYAAHAADIAERLRRWVETLAPERRQAREEQSRAATRRSLARRAMADLVRDTQELLRRHENRE